MAFGFPEQLGGKIYNSMAVIDQEGSLIDVYRKIQLFGKSETTLFERGDKFSVCKLNGATLGLGICYDIEFPEFGRRLAQQEVDIAVVPTANMDPYWEVPTTLVRARALENRMAVVYANQCGEDESARYTGMSCIVGSDGHDLVRAGISSEAFIVADVDVASDRPDVATATQLQDITVGIQRLEIAVK